MGRFVLIPKPRTETSIPHRLSDGAYIVGRANDCEVFVDNPSVSRRHARLTVAGCELAVTDLGSRNGTFINGERTRAGHARPGELVAFGTATFQVSMQSLNHSVRTDEDTVSGKRIPAPPLEPPFSHVTPAQQRILDCVMEGLGQKQIAARLFLSEHTVHAHLRALYRLFDVHSQAELMARAMPMRR